MKAEDWLELPERVDRVVLVHMPPDAKESYKTMERDFIDGDVVADTEAVLVGKLLQMANGAVYDENGVREVHQAKLDALEDIIEAGKPVLVFYNYKHDLDRIRQRFDVRLLDSPSDIHDWNAGRIPILLAHPASAGHGLNLQAGGNIIVWFGLTWSLELYEQANARLHRQGQQEKVIIHHLVTAGTVDEDVMRALENKAIKQNDLIRAVKARVNADQHKFSM
jgi:SNF2 family DNA or RNA helicase